MMRKFLLATLLLIASPALVHAQNAWTNTFSIPIFNRALPGVSTNALTIPVVVGQTASGSVFLENGGTQPISFTIANTAETTTYGGTWKIISGWVNFSPSSDKPDTRTWSGSPRSTTFDLGFSFPYDSQGFTSVGVRTDGRITLDGTKSVLLPFSSGNLRIADTKNIRFDKRDGLAIIYWEGAWERSDGSLVNRHFQAHLYQSGEIRYLYKDMTEAKVTDADIGVIFNRVTIVFEDGSNDEVDVLSNNSMLVLTPKIPIVASLFAGSVSRDSRSELRFTVDSDQLTGVPPPFDFIVNWGDGSTNIVTVTVAFEPERIDLVLSGTPVSISAPVGGVGTSTMSVSNNGNMPLNYSFVDTTARQQGYTWEKSPFLWNPSSGVELTPADDDPVAKDRGVSGLLPLGFIFPYWGSAYTHFSIGIDGYISLGTAGINSEQIIAPLLSNLYYDNNSEVRVNIEGGQVVVTWKNLQGVENDQSFQAVLNQNGKITFRYLELQGPDMWKSSNMNNAVDDARAGVANPRVGIGVRDTSSRVRQNTLVYEATGTDRNDGTVYYTNQVTTTTTPANSDNPHAVIVTYTTNRVAVYDNPLRQESWTYVPITLPVTVSPSIGTLQPGESQTITMTGDARNLGAGTTVGAFNIESEDDTKTVSVVFTVTAPSGAELADSDGDGQTDMAELIAGTDAQNADSFFSANMDGSRTISWTAPNGGSLNRTYTIWFATDLREEWEPLATVENMTSYTDTEHNDVSSIYYKVTID